MSNLVDLNLVKTVGTTLYVPPTVYSKSSVRKSTKKAYK